MNITIADIDNAQDARAVSEMFAVLAEHFDGAPARAPRQPRRSRGAAAATDTPAPTAQADAPATTAATPAPAPVATVAPVTPTPAAGPTDAVALYAALTGATGAAVVPATVTPPATVVPATVTPEPAVASPEARAALETRARATAQDRGAVWFMPWMEANVPADRRQVAKMTDDELNRMIAAAAMA